MGFFAVGIFSFLSTLFIYLFVVHFAWDKFIRPWVFSEKTALTIINGGATNSPVLTVPAK